MEDEAHPGERLVDPRGLVEGEEAALEAQLLGERADLVRAAAGEDRPVTARGREARHELARVPVRAVEQPGTGHDHPRALTSRSSPCGSRCFRSGR